MIKSINEKSNEIVIDLTGPEGNAFVLLGYASKWAKQLGLDSADIQNQMTTGDYENLLMVFEKYFGSFVTLYR